jgi:MFS family permease
MTPPAATRAARALGVVLLGAAVSPLDTAVNIALPAITAAFALGLPEIRWIVIVYVLTYGSTMLICGRLGDLFGYLRVFRAGLVVTVFGLAGCALAPAWGGLLAARVVQGVGIALTLGCAPALALSVYAEGERTRVLGIYAATFAAGLALGPLAGGLLLTLFDWRAVFWARLPLALGALALLGWIPAQTRAAGGRRFDAPGALLLAGWMSALLLAFALSGALAAALGLAALAGLGAFLWHAARTASPILRLALFRDPSFSLFNLLSIAVNLTGFSVFLIAPYFFVRVAGAAPGWAGLLLAVSPFAAMLGAMLAARAAPRLGVRLLALAGVALCAAGLGWIAFWGASSGSAEMIAALALQGAGVGLFQVGYTDIVIAALPLEDRGVAGSLTMVTRTLGVVTAATLLWGLFAHAEGAALAGGAPATDAFVAGFRFAFGCAAAGLGGCLAAALAWRALAGRF